MILGGLNGYIAWKLISILKAPLLLRNKKVLPNQYVSFILLDNVAVPHSAFADLCRRFHYPAGCHFGPDPGL